MPHRPEFAWRGLLSLLLALMMQPVAASAFDMTELMALMGRVETSSVAFQETKYVSTLTAPIVRRGTLRYVRPDRLEMRVETPYFERMDIVGNMLTIESKRGLRQVDLAGEPGPAAWVAGIRATLAGDRPTLARHFAFELRGQAARWTLSLMPLDPALSGVIQRIAIDGEQAQMTRIEVEERMGDRTVLIIETGAR
jgi:Outer membrane lipoprotein carrier protein LolA-like